MKFALCNEVLQPLPFARAMRAGRGAGLRRAGSRAVHAGRRPDRASPTRRRAQFRRIARGPRPARSPACTGCWSRRRACRSSSADAALRERTAAVMRAAGRAVRGDGRQLPGARLAEAALGAGRASTREQALERATRLLGARGAARAQACGVIYCIEPLSPRETDLINTVAEAAELVDAIGSPGLQDHDRLQRRRPGRSRSRSHALMARWMPDRPHRATCRSTTPTGAARARASMRFAPILRSACADAAARPLRRHRRGRAVRLRARRRRAAAARAIGYLQRHARRTGSAWLKRPRFACARSSCTSGR